MAKVVNVKRTGVEKVTVELTAQEAAVLLAITGRCNGVYLDGLYHVLRGIEGLPTVNYRADQSLPPIPLWSTIEGVSF